MRKKLLLFIVSVVAFGFTFSCVNAATNCEDARQAELIKIANAITTNYEEEEKTETYYDTDFPNGNEFKNNYLKISIYNVTSDVYIEVSNNMNKDVVTYKGSDYSNGVISFNQNDMTVIANYTLKIYSADGNCYGSLLTTKYISIPIYNTYSNRDFCIEHPDLDFCQKYINYDLFTEGEFAKKIDDYNDSSKKNEATNDSDDKITEFVKDNKYIFIGVGCVVLLALGSAIYIAAKRKRSKLI